MQGPWVVGALINNQWSVTGWGDKDVNQMLLQYFINYNMVEGLVYHLIADPHTVRDRAPIDGQ